MSDIEVSFSRMTLILLSSLIKKEICLIGDIINDPFLINLLLFFHLDFGNSHIIYSHLHFLWVMFGPQTKLGQIGEGVDINPTVRW